MPIELTEQQRWTLDVAGETPPRVVDSRTHAADVLMPAGAYEVVQAVLDVERSQRAIRKVGPRNAIGRRGGEP